MGSTRMLYYVSCGFDSLDGRKTSVNAIRYTHDVARTHDHSDDCYFCKTPNLIGFNRKNKDSITYPTVRSAVRPKPHDKDFRVPMPPLASDLSEEEDNFSCHDSDADTDDTEFEDTDQPQKFDQAQLNDLVRDLKLSKRKSEILASRLKERNLLDKEVKITAFRERDMEFAQFYDVENGITFCIDVNGLMRKLGMEHNPEEWRLFIDSSKASMKAVLLHIGNKHPSVPLLHASNMPETHASMKVLTKLIKYEEHQWRICCDLKVVSLLLGLQLGYTKYMCFLCLWDSRDDAHHFRRKDWPRRSSLDTGKHNVVQAPLIAPDKIILPPLHIKLGLMKNFVKALPVDGFGFSFLRDKFPSLSDQKLRAGVFTGPQIRQLLKDTDFEAALTYEELSAWLSFKEVVAGFLGNYRASNYVEAINKLLRTFQRIGCRMSLKIHFLHSHLDFFPPNLGDVSDEHGERFHQEMMVMESRYQGRFDPRMMGDYCWFLVRETNNDHVRRGPKKHF